MSALCRFSDKASNGSASPLNFAASSAAFSMLRLTMINLPVPRDTRVLRVSSPILPEPMIMAVLSANSMKIDTARSTATEPMDTLPALMCVLVFTLLAIEKAF